jgi:hypothetical protein
MGGLIHTPGTGYLCWFYNSEFENNWAFHQANAGAYTGNSVWNVIDTLRQGATKPLMPTPPAAYPNLVARWRLFFERPIFTPANQAALLKAIHDALASGTVSGITLGVRHGSSQKVDNVPANGGVKIQLINIVVVGAMPTGRDDKGAPDGSGVPAIDMP